MPSNTLSPEEVKSVACLRTLNLFQNEQKKNCDNRDTMDHPTHEHPENDKCNCPDGTPVSLKFFDFGNGNGKSASKLSCWECKKHISWKTIKKGCKCCIIY